MFYSDTWTTRIPPIKIAAYKIALGTERIRNIRITYYRQTGITQVDYESDLTKDQVKTELKRIAKEMIA